jgi:hypothetical protein
MTSTCKHCTLAIHSDSGKPDTWVHSEGYQARLHRCAVDPYGYDAAPEGDPCSHACLGSRTGNQGLVVPP